MKFSSDHQIDLVSVCSLSSGIHTWEQKFIGLDWNFVSSMGTCTKSVELWTLQIILALAYILYYLFAIESQLQKKE